MEQRPSVETKSRTANQEMLRLLWNQKVNYHVHKSSPPVPILTQKNPVHTLTHYNSVRSIWIASYPQRIGLPSSLFPSSIPTEILYHFSPISPMCVLSISSSLIWSS
jgi:hypothetical protein